MWAIFKGASKRSIRGPIDRNKTTPHSPTGRQTDKHTHTHTHTHTPLANKLTHKQYGIARARERLRSRDIET